MVWGVGIVCVLVVVNAFFVAAEYALVRVRRTRIEALAAQGSGLAKVVLHGLNHIDQYIAGVQVGITLAGLASGRFGEPVLAAIFDPLFARIVPPSLIGAEASTALATGFTLLVISYLLVVLGELVPKAIALQYTDQVALLVAKPMQLAVWVFTPFVWSMNALGNGVLRLLRLPPPAAGDGAYSGRGVAPAHCAESPGRDSGGHRAPPDAAQHAVRRLARGGRHDSPPRHRRPGSRTAA
jgi:CBS domain containing-hemolysin-like protein